MSAKIASVIIPTFNKKERLGLTIESFKYQGVDDDCFELIIIDDGSSDGTEELIKNLECNFEIRYIKQINQGRSKARNTGVNKSRGDILIFCDDDLIVSKDFIESHIKEHGESQNNVVHGLIYNLPYLKFFKNPTTGELYSETENVSLDFIKRLLISKADLKEMTRIDKQKKLTLFENIIQSTFLLQIYELQWLCFTGGNVSCKKELFKRVGMFDGSFGRKWGCEDFEMGYRLYLKGAKFRYSKDAYNYHMVHARMTFREEIEEAVSKFYFKHPDPYILHLSKLLSGEIKDLEAYMDYVKNNHGLH